MRVDSVRVASLDAPMNEPFEVATGVQTEVRNFLVVLRLSDGTLGFGECAPSTPKRLGDLAPIRRKLERAANALEGAPAGDLEGFAERANELCAGHGASRAALEMALLDAWTKSKRVPLYVYFGGAGAKVATDITVPIVPAPQAEDAARRIRARGVLTIKIKVGVDLEEDEARVRAVVRGAPRARLILDANQGYRPGEAVRLLRRLARARIRPSLYEQPVHKADLEGLAEVERKGGVPVAADESAAGLADVWRIAKKRACSVVNLKLMKSGLWESWQAARAARAAGLRLMLGGMVETRLAMGCAAHLASGFGGFEFLDLDTPLWLAEDPMSGPPSIGRGGLYDLGSVRAGIGCRPKGPKDPGAKRTYA